MPRRTVMHSLPDGEGDDQTDLRTALQAAWVACVANRLTLDEYSQLLRWVAGCEQQLADSFETFGHIYRKSFGRVVSRMDGVTVGVYTVRLIAQLGDEQTGVIVPLPSDTPLG